MRQLHVDKAIFPNKPRSVVVSDFSAPPEHGAVIPSNNDTLATVGLKASDVIVAIDGKQVDNSRQYNFILGLSNSDEKNLIVFRDGKYMAIHATTPGRRFGINMEDYRH